LASQPWPASLGQPALATPTQPNQSLHRQD